MIDFQYDEATDTMVTDLYGDAVATINEYRGDFIVTFISGPSDRRYEAEVGTFPTLWAAIRRVRQENETLRDADMAIAAEMEAAYIAEEQGIV